MASSNTATTQCAETLETQVLSSEEEHILEILTGLHTQPKTINPKFFYDSTGSQLFEEITKVEEYYPTRTEIKILKQYAHEIADMLGDNVQLIEPGAGSCEKVRYLLDSLRPQRYLPMDISMEFLQDSASQLKSEYPWLNIKPIAADFNHDINFPNFPSNSKKVVFYPGSTIGNFEPAKAIEFLRRLGRWTKPNGGILLGVDLQKDHSILNAAYNDASGITEQFNLNILNNINSIVDGNFNSNNFSHQAFYNADKNRIEMHLQAETSHIVSCGQENIRFEKNETIHTENSYKYTLQGIAELAEKSGLKLQKSWCDDQQLFSMNYLILKN